MPVIPGFRRKFPRGAKPSPRHVLAGARPHRPSATPPAQVAYVPQRLDYWGNDRYGDCVSAEEAFAKACYTPEIFVPADTVISWAGPRGYLDGADLTPVMQSMETGGFQLAGQLYNDGPYSAVDYSNEAVLQSAIALGPVKIAIDANALPSGAGKQQGWYAVSGGHFPNTDHCVSLCGYGTAAWLFQQLKVTLPAGLAADMPGYLLFTWSTIGFVTHAWIMSTCAEAWMRNPTTIGVPPLTPPAPPAPPPAPVPTPAPTPAPPAPAGDTLTMTAALGAGSYPIGDPARPVATLLVPVTIAAGSFPLNVPT